MEKKLVLWILAFVCVFSLSQDYLFVEWRNTPDFLGFPLWMYWFILIHIVFIAVLYLFNKRYQNR